MSYFKNIKENDKVFGLVYGPGKVRTVFDGYYKFEVEYQNGQIVPYTDNGNPGWNTGDLDFQTVFYKNDIDLFDFDFSPSEESLSPKKIIKLRDKKKLEAKCESGIWRNVTECPQNIVEEYLENNRLHLFRKAYK